MSSLSLLDHLRTQLGVYTDDLCTCYKEIYSNQRMMLLFMSTKISPILWVWDGEPLEGKDQGP